MVQTEGARPSYFIPVFFHKRFVNMVLLPALDIILDTSVVPVPLDYQSAADFGLGKGITLSMEEVTQLISLMRGILSRNSSLSIIFGDFFFVTWGMGIKSRFVWGETFAHALSSQGFIWDKIDLRNFYLDLGIYFASSQLGLTGLWSTGEGKDFQPILELLFDDKSFHKSKYRHEPSCCHSGIGGFKYGNRKSGLIRGSAYSHSKQPFYSRSAYGERHGKDFNADEAFKISPGFIKHLSKMKHCLSLMKYKSYGVRLEVRFTANNWDVLYGHTMNLAKYVIDIIHINIERYFLRNRLQAHINWYKSDALSFFVKNRLDTQVALAKNFHGQKYSRYAARQLTGVAVVAFMLSSLVHRPSHRSWWRPFADQLEAHRCRKSMALFVPGLFKLSEDGCHWSSAISMKQYLRGVLHRDIINKIVPDHGYEVKLPEWHYKFPMLLEQSSTTNNLNFDLGLYDQYIDLVNKENYYWDRAVMYIGYYGLSDDCVEPFAHLVMHELLSKFSKWDRYCKDQQSHEKIYKYGSNFFCTKSDLNEIVKVPSYIVIQLGY
ncbi:hypothetical protein G6F43_012380 [Rhizopus delemar]|nr:hypothetical protein G6F43_012380 [Rhizopus delemar]